MLFAVTPICFTCCLDEQLVICHISLHFVLQVAFSALNLLLIILQWSRRHFFQCDILQLCTNTKDRARRHIASGHHVLKCWQHLCPCSQFMLTVHAHSPCSWPCDLCPRTDMSAFHIIHYSDTVCCIIRRVQCISYLTSLSAGQFYHKSVSLKRVLLHLLFSLFVHIKYISMSHSQWRVCKCKSFCRITINLMAIFNKAWIKKKHEFAHVYYKLQKKCF